MTRALWGSIVCLGILGSTLTAAEPKEVLLWPNGAPQAVGSEAEDRPTVTIYQADPQTATGAAFVVCPGGGYGRLAMDHEGKQIAEWLNSIGVTAAILKYRLGPRYHHPAPLQDAQRAIRYLRANAKDLQIDPQRIGIWGFSAGGHLASTASTHFDKGDAASSDPVAQQSSRPDFAVLAYPVISFIEPFTHKGSRKNLLGENPDPELVKSLSNETQVTAETPPTFLFHTSEDKGVPPQNSLVYYDALHKNGVPCELHIYQPGRHGLGFATDIPALAGWRDRVEAWMNVNGFLTKKN